MFSQLNNHGASRKRYFWKEDKKSANSNLPKNYVRLLYTLKSRKYTVLRVVNLSSSRLKGVWRGNCSQICEGFAQEYISALKHQRKHKSSRMDLTLACPIIFITLRRRDWIVAVKENEKRKSYVTRIEWKWWWRYFCSPLSRDSKTTVEWSLRATISYWTEKHKKDLDLPFIFTQVFMRDRSVQISVAILSIFQGLRGHCELK